jgi:hypothetical protein
MDLNYFEQKLLAKQLQLQSDLAALEGEARDAGDVEARDNTDDATADQSTSEALEEGGVISQTSNSAARRGCPATNQRWHFRKMHDLRTSDSTCPPRGDSLD